MIVPNYATTVKDQELIISKLEKEKQEFKNQQKEFIEWLENIVGNLEKQQSLRFNHSYQYKIDTLKSCLSKYKEIIGVKDERIRICCIDTSLQKG